METAGSYEPSEQIYQTRRCYIREGNSIYFLSSLYKKQRVSEIGCISVVRWILKHFKLETKISLTNVRSQKQPHSYGVLCFVNIIGNSDKGSRLFRTTRCQATQRDG